MFSIFNRNKRITGLDWLGADIHNHLLPGIDDGASEIKDSMMLVEGLKRLGFKSAIPTPHIFQELYPNKPENIHQSYQSLKAHGQIADFIPSVAAEYMLDDHFSAHMEQPLLALRDNYVLVEMSYLYESPHLDEYIFQLQLKNYQPILAHPERYQFFHGKPNRIRSLKDRGVFLQVNLLSFGGYYGKNEKRLALEMAKKGWIDFVGTDIHHERHLAALTALSNSGTIHEVLSENKLKNHEFLG